MDQKKTGAFFKQLRTGKGLTQEQLAEKLGVSRRTVSRWETGSNMPDLSLLVEISELYSVELSELLSGERKEQKMEEQKKREAVELARYSMRENGKTAKRMGLYFILGAVTVIVGGILSVSGGDSPAVGFIRGLCFGLSLAIMLMGALYSAGMLSKLRRVKLRLLKRENGK